MFQITSAVHPQFDDLFTTGEGKEATPILPLGPAQLAEIDLSPDERAWAAAGGFTGGAGQVVPVPGKDGRLARVLFGLGESSGAAPGPYPYVTAALSQKLPEGRYRFEAPVEGVAPVLAALGWAMGRYGFSRYKAEADAKTPPRLLLPADCPKEELAGLIEAVFLTRDLINTPANDMGPEQLEAAALTLAKHHGARATVVLGDDLPAQNFPLIHAVGRAAARAPRLIDIQAGDPAHPKVTLVGKGVCFDTGGLNLKPESAMALMKKDMGGAAHVLGLAHLILGQGLPVRLRVLIPAVENAVSGSAFRPGDVYPSRNGLTVEIGNTDAEGRLVLADALVLAGEETPDLLINMATLTGAARAALGPDLPPFYTPDDELAGALQTLSRDLIDPLWRLPLWPGYDGWLDSKIANVSHIADSPSAGSVTAALFLQRFITAKSWAHFDIFAWTAKPKPGQPVGGEAQGLRALFQLLKDRYGAS